MTPELLFEYVFAVVLALGLGVLTVWFMAVMMGVGAK